MEIGPCDPGFSVSIVKSVKKNEEEICIYTEKGIYKINTGGKSVKLLKMKSESGSITSIPVETLGIKSIRHSPDFSIIIVYVYSSDGATLVFVDQETGAELGQAGFSNDTFFEFGNDFFCARDEGNARIFSYPKLGAQISLHGDAKKWLGNGFSNLKCKILTEWNGKKVDVFFFSYRVQFKEKLVIIVDGLIVREHEDCGEVYSVETAPDGSVLLMTSHRPSGVITWYKVETGFKILEKGRFNRQPPLYDVDIFALNENFIAVMKNPYFVMFYATGFSKPVCVVESKGIDPKIFPVTGKSDMFEFICDSGERESFFVKLGAPRVSIVTDEGVILENGIAYCNLHENVRKIEIDHPSSIHVKKRETGERKIKIGTDYLGNIKKIDMKSTIRMVRNTMKECHVLRLCNNRLRNTGKPYLPGELLNLIIDGMVDQEMKRHMV